MGVNIKMKLHEAIVTILKEHKGKLSTIEIAKEINNRQLYRKKDGSKVQAIQIFLRCRSPMYRRLFNEVSQEYITLDIV